MSRLSLLFRPVNILILTSGLSTFVIAGESTFSWPANAKAAVSLSYDDALDSHLDNAIPQLDHYNFKASFYITTSSESFVTRQQAWALAAKTGHELGNHTVNHYCRASLPNREWVKPEEDLDLKTAQSLIEEVKQANSILSALDGEYERTFTVPCTDKLAGGVDLSLIHI